MRNTWLLLKLQLEGIYGIHKVRNWTSRRSKWLKPLIVLGAGLLYLLIMGVVGSYVFFFAYGLNSIGQIKLVPILGVALTSILAVITSITKSPGTLFAFKDDDFTLALPVSITAVVASRMLLLYVYELIAAITLMIPFAVVYGFFAYPAISFYIVYFVIVLVVPLIPVVLGTIVGTIVQAAASRLRFANLIVIVLTSALALGSMSIGFFMQKDIRLIGQSIESLLMDSFSRIYPPIKLLANVLLEGDMMSFALFAGVSVLAFLAFGWLIARVFNSINSRLTAVRSKGQYKLSSLNEGFSFWALFKKEARMYFASAVYVVNSSMGLLMMVALSLAAVVVGGDKLMSFLSIPIVGSYVRTFLPLLIPLMLCFFLSTCNISASSISMEGSRFWIIKSLPIPERELLAVKTFFSFVVMAFPTVLSAAVIGIAFKLSVQEVLFALAVACIFAAYMSITGLMANLWLPKMEWKNEVAVVKQGMAVLVSMLLGFAPILLAGFLSYKAIGWGMAAALWVAFGAIAILTLAAAIVLYGKGPKWLRRIPA